MTQLGLHLKRVAINGAGAFGVALWDGIPFAVTVERTYPDGPRGAQRIKIAPGEYALERAYYNRGQYPVWQVIGGAVTKDRLIYIHKGNVEDDVDGCIAIGEQFEWLNGKPAVLQSGKAFAELMRLTESQQSYTLLVENC